MNTQFVNDEGVMLVNAGTSEGASKGWESRGSVPVIPAGTEKAVKASENAQNASDVAKQTGHSVDHEEAAAAHKIAAGLHERAGIRAKEGYARRFHSDLAKAHEDKAKEHSDKAGLAKTDEYAESLGWKKVKGLADD